MSMNFSPQGSSQPTVSHESHSPDNSSARTLEDPIQSQAQSTVTNVLARPSLGSHTQTVILAVPQETAFSDEAVVGVLQLEGGNLDSNQRRVMWDDTAIDNELLGRKKSKVCCIYRKPHRPDGSSSSDCSSSEDSDPNEPNAYELQPRRSKHLQRKHHQTQTPHHKHNHNHDHDHGPIPSSSTA
ncbi:hypothetical protein BASA50_003054 [Batrachochytrium salamandrivorans]|uniref:Type 1 phosphatases regulator n=1 Tax=Batrachochytrium salamandrivorans TaxID=1357716 RepID=A0ABQ8FMK4_9FUNG|nr:hypothetical protein BASA50_003054 [Batrachochytrium salamandrivorans]